MSANVVLKLEQLAALVVAAGLAIVSYLLFFSWAGGGGYERRQRSTDQALLSSPVKMTISRRSPEMTELKGRHVP